jgi:prepilin peptidase CpaA
MITDAIPLAVAVGLAAAAAITDWRTGRIPNWLTLPPLMAAPVAYLLLAGMQGFLFSLLGALACGAVPYLLFRRRAMGGGDVKLLAAIGALVGTMVGIEVELLGFVIAACYAIAMRAFSGGFGTLVHNCFFLVANPFLPPHWQRELRRAEMTSLRLGGFLLLGLCVAVALRCQPLWS